jgi:hypothetical protein
MASNKRSKLMSRPVPSVFVITGKEHQTFDSLTVSTPQKRKRFDTYLVIIHLC